MTPLSRLPVHDVYVNIIDKESEEAVPEDFNDAWLFLALKGGIEDEGAIFRHASKLRPISSSNADGKLVEGALADPLLEVLPNEIVEQQSVSARNTEIIKMGKSSLFRVEMKRPCSNDVWQ